VELCNEDGCLKADGAHSGAIVEVPQHHLPVLPGAEEVAVVHGPAQRLHLARVAAELARNAVCLDVEDDDNAIMLWCGQLRSQAGVEVRLHVQMRAGRRDG